jgi:hypothetical protein
MRTPGMPVKVRPYRHQVEAFRFACRLFGLKERGFSVDDNLCDLRNADSKETEPRQDANK